MVLSVASKSIYKSVEIVQSDAEKLSRFFERHYLHINDEESTINIFYGEAVGKTLLNDGSYSLAMSW